MIIVHIKKYNTMMALAGMQDKADGDKGNTRVAIDNRIANQMLVNGNSTKAILIMSDLAGMEEVVNNEAPDLADVYTPEQVFGYRTTIDHTESTEMVDREVQVFDHTEPRFITVVSYGDPVVTEEEVDGVMTTVTHHPRIEEEVEDGVNIIYRTEIEQEEVTVLTPVYEHTPRDPAVWALYVDCYDMSVQPVLDEEGVPTGEMFRPPVLPYMIAGHNVEDINLIHPDDS